MWERIRHWRRSRRREEEEEEEESFKKNGGKRVGGLHSARGGRRERVVERRQGAAGQSAQLGCFENTLLKASAFIHAFCFLALLCLPV